MTASTVSGTAPGTTAGETGAVMRAMVIASMAADRGEGDALVPRDMPVPAPGRGSVRVRVSVCGVCHTELDEVDGLTPPAVLPRVPGHQVVGVIDAIGAGVNSSWLGTRVGVAWIFRACGTCAACMNGRENLCDRFQATGRDVDGGYAEHMVAPVDFVHRLPPGFPDEAAAPLLCAGAIGCRALRLARITDGQSLGLTGFGASAHLVLLMARRLYPASPVFVFARSDEEREFALALGAAWAGDVSEAPPRPLTAIIDTTPVWAPLVAALGHLEPGGRLIVNAIRKSDVDKAALLTLDYARDLWMEKTVVSVANVTRADVHGCLDLAASIPLRPAVTTYALEDANAALADLRRGVGHGARVLRVAGR